MKFQQVFWLLLLWLFQLQEHQKYYYIHYFLNQFLVQSLILKAGTCRFSWRCCSQAARHAVLRARAARPPRWGYRGWRGTWWWGPWWGPPMFLPMSLRNLFNQKNLSAQKNSLLESLGWAFGRKGWSMSGINSGKSVVLSGKICLRELQKVIRLSRRAATPTFTPGVDLFQNSEPSSRS